MSRLALGTVQFGLTYGVANSAGKVNPEEVIRILKTARDHGVDTLDTAIAYGDAEQALGTAGVDGFHIVTKLPPLPEGVTDLRRWVVCEIEGSLQRLQVPSVDAVLLHRSQDIIGPHFEAYQAGLADLKERGLCRATGVSIYAPSELETIWAHISGWRPDLVQAPYNVLDRRLLTSGWLDHLSQAGVRVHVRSAFLQGLLLMAADKRPAYFTPWAELLDEWSRFCEEQTVSPLIAALTFAVSEKRLEKVVVGVDSATQLAEIIAGLAVNAALPVPDVACDTLDLIDPSRWKLS
jgi:aryl-alcohol dehydrogenase-like predicted oxidoreductase